MTKIKIILYLILLTFALSARSVKVGIYSDKPIIYRDSDGQIKGFYADIINKIAESEGWELEFVEGTWNETLTKLKTGEIDLTTSITIVEERLPYMDFNQEHLYVMWSELYTSSSSESDNVLDYEGKKIGILSNGANGIYFKKLMKDLEISFTPVEYESFSDIFHDLKAGKIDGGVCNNIFGYTHLEEYGLSKPILIFNPYKMYFAAPKNKNADLLTKIDEYIEEWKNDNESFLYESLNKWFGYNKLVVEIKPRKHLIITHLLIAFLIMIMVILYIIRIKQRKDSIEHNIKREYWAVKERYQNLLNLSSDGVLLMDSNEKIFEVNPAMTELSGYSQKDFADLGLEDLFLKDESSSLETLRIAMDSDETFFGKISILNRDNSRIPTEVNGTVLEVNRKKYYLLTIKDISGIIKVQDELRLSELKTQKIFESNMMGILLWNADGTILDCNSKFLDIIGYSRDDLEAGIFWKNITPVEYQQADEEILKETFLTGVCDPYEKEFIHKNGARVRVLMGASIIDEAKKYGFAFAIDLTETKGIELELAEKQLEVKQIYNMATPICLISTDHRILQVNDSFSEIFGMDRDKVVSLTCGEIWDEDICRQKIEVQKRIIDGDVIVTYEIKRKLDNGGTTTYSVASKPFYNLSGELIGIVENYFDITVWKHTENELREYQGNLSTIVSDRTSELESKQDSLQESQQALTFLLEDVNDSRQELYALNNKLEQANDDLESFAYSVSHDLRAPLRHISGFSQLLMNNFTEVLDEKAVHYLKTIVKSTGMMGTLIDDLLVFSRMGRTRMQKLNIKLNSLIGDIIDDMNPDYDADKLEWDVKELVDIYGDPTLIRQVFINLIANSIKFSKHRELAKIQIGCRVEEDHTLYFVKDNGVGFDMRYVDKLFGVFQRLHRQEDFEGTGIGLANVKRIVTRHGGKVWAEGVPEEGATFYFTMPKID